MSQEVRSTLLSTYQIFPRYLDVLPPVVNSVASSSKNSHGKFEMRDWLSIASTGLPRDEQKENETQTTYSTKQQKEDEAKRSCSVRDCELDPSPVHIGNRPPPTCTKEREQTPLAVSCQRCGCGAALLPPFISPKLFNLGSGQVGTFGSAVVSDPEGCAKVSTVFLHWASFHLFIGVPED